MHKTSLMSSIISYENHWKTIICLLPPRFQNEKFLITEFESKLRKLKAPQPHNSPGFKRSNNNDNNNNKNNNDNKNKNKNGHTWIHFRGVPLQVNCNRKYPTFLEKIFGTK